MSAYITQLDILGFDDGVAAWTQKVNTVEEGGGGGGAMSETCFTLDTSVLSDWGIFERIEGETAAYLPNQIRLNGDVWPNDGSPVYVYHLTMTVTPEYAGRQPESITVHFIGDLTEGLTRSYHFQFVARDQSYDLGIHSVAYNVNAEDPVQPPLDIEFTIPLTYRTLEEDEETPYTSDGLVTVSIADSSGVPS